MANYFFIVGVGGAGRGVCNHLKYELEQYYGSLSAARTQVLVIDGPVSSDQYALPGGFEINTDPNSPEFIQCHAAASPDAQIQAIAAGNIQPKSAAEYIARWLSPQEAAKIPLPVNPEGGFGGHRASGHAYVYTDVARLRQSLELAYNRVKQLQGSQSQQGSRVLCFIIGSHSGGTGAGMLWDIAAMVRPLTMDRLDSLHAIIPLANSYHSLVDTEARKQEVDAKNYAGLLNLIRFMSIGKVPLPVAFEYSDHDVFHNRTNIVECPFLLDGDNVGCKLNDIVPSRGVVPAIADWLMTVIKDDLVGTNHIAAGDSVNWQNHIGSDPSQMLGSFGTSSISYPWKEVLQTFKYRFAWAVFEEMLKPSGPLAGEGPKRAQQVLGGSPFGVMIERGTVDLSQKNWKTVRDQLRTHGRSKNKNRPLPVHQGSSDVVKLKSMGLFKRKDDEVIRDADLHRNTTVNNVSNWINHQCGVIVADLQSDIEQVVFDLFMERITDSAGHEQYHPRSLGQNYRNSITVAKDYLLYLRHKMESLAGTVQQEFNRQFYPTGPNQPSLIAQLQATAQEKIRVMQASPGDVTNEQEEYLRAVDKLLEAEVWHMLVQALQHALSDGRSIVEGLWDMIGYSATGWCHILDQAREAYAKRYAEDKSRRLEWSQMRLRTYIPTPGAEAEDQLFAQAADPHLDGFFDQSSWHIALNPAGKGADRYELVLEYPGLKGKEREAVEMRTLLGDQVQVSQFNSDRIVSWAEDQLKNPLESRTIWDIMVLDFESDWLGRKAKSAESLSASDRSSLENQYVSEKINLVLNQSAALWTLSGNNFQNRQTWGTWGRFINAAVPTDIATRFSAELQRRQEPLRQAGELPHEIRRAVGYFRAPLTGWSYHSACYGHYLAYMQNPTGVLVDIYTNEQNAHQVRHWIQQYVDPSMSDMLDVSVVALLGDLGLFRLYALCYTMDLIPKRNGASATAPDIYCLGHIQLGSVLDIDALSFNILRTHLQVAGGIWQANDVAQRELKRIWRDHEAANSDPTKMSVLLTQLKARAETISFPSMQGKQPIIHHAHLKAAFQGAVYGFIDEVRVARQLASAAPSQSTPAPTSSGVP
jgi:hypothetical protein